MRTRKIYTRDLFNQFGYLATWLPGTPLELGDIGILNGREFTKIGNLKDHGLTFEIEEDYTPTDLDYSSKNAVSITTKLSGAPVPAGSTLTEIDAGISIKFSKENAILLKAKDTTTPAIKDQITLGNKILELFKKGEWNHKWAVITELVHATNCSILISSSKEGHIDLKATANIATNAIDITDTSFEFVDSFSKDVSTSLIARKGLTPMFKVSKVRRRFVAPPIFKFKGIDSLDLVTPKHIEKQNDEFYFGEPLYKDYLEIE